MYDKARKIAALLGALVLSGVPLQAEAAEAGPLVGPVTREQVEAAVPDWVEAEVEAAPDAEATHALATVDAEGAAVEVFFGTWCSDSRREVSRLWRAIDEAGGTLPFQITYIAVDRAKREPADRLDGIDLRYVPTFVVRRGGREVGRIVEGAPHGIESDLLALLRGTFHGVVSTRDDVGAAAPSPEPPPG